MAEFCETRMGVKFFERDVPKMIEALTRIALALEVIASPKPGGGNDDD